ncbi:anthocyanidin 3-O-glucosyltransferase 2 [Cinnamomum micranthum f. kanehirae]|uniref:Anthocyanidin 3-O-glucosyltransferase 2 n=1 Tax=Cinnamomum micranthum f. kanehirae TaxID=337451 RepID=A0A3S3MHU8_9MAGN|nr:anthocyanidin 3-O-glucosyltransferase 2 [Cinnamomum micranthum f. kanehirae]
MENPGLLFLPSPGVGHLIPTVELAKGLLDKQPCFSITVFLMHLHIPSMKDATTTASYIQSVAASHPRIHFIDLPLVDFPFENTNNPVGFFSLFIDKHKSYVKEAIKSTSSSSSPPATALIIDLFSTTMIDVGKELGIPTYLYFTSGADLLGLMLYLPTLDVKVPCEFKDYRGEVEVPGMLPLPPLVMPDPMMNKKSDGYEWFVYHGRRFRETNGIIMNTFEELEPTTLKSVT